MLIDYIPRHTYGIAASYRDGKIISVIAGVQIFADNSLKLRFPKTNPFKRRDTITIHLDNRTGVDTYDADLKVYRCSYKGSIVDSGDDEARIIPLEYSLVYSHQVVESYKAPVFEYSEDPRPAVPVPESPLKSLSMADGNEEENKLGVLVTKSVDFPQTSVMAFLNTVDDDIFIITRGATRKAHNLHRDSDCYFAIDHRANFVFENAYEWNYTIIKGRAFTIPPRNPIFHDIQQKFVEKNPWELVFFGAPDIELFHIEPDEIMCPEKYAGLRVAQRQLNYSG